MYLCTHVRMCVCMYVCMYVCKHVRVCVCVYVCAHMCYVYIHGLHIRKFFTLACRGVRGFPRLMAVRMIHRGSLHWCVLFMGPQYGVCCVSPFRLLELRGGDYIFTKFMQPHFVVSYLEALSDDRNMDHSWSHRNIAMLVTQVTELFKIFQNNAIKRNNHPTLPHPQCGL
jgi:hypothetical protein